ncbi:MAG TPA: RagB/SusD family nutrient uptake outer membrane protein [Puia sp.]|nr:RagB/SusD family nutrient uptake outer membrane protein [Puia sp.]
MQYKFFSRLFLFVLMTGVAAAVNSCKKYLEPSAQSSFNTAYVFSNVQNAQKAVFSVYADLEGDQGYGIRISMYYPYDNDEMIGMHQLGDNDRGDIAHYNATAGNAQLYSPWVQLYQGIERANICIYNLPKMPLYTQGNAQQTGELQRLYGEALTLRAQFYFELIRNWGDVPAQWVPSSVADSLFLAKTDRDSIYDHLLNDLAIAENIVPWRTEVTALGDALDQRITQGAVRGLRARIALNRGGYSLRRASSMYGQTMARPADYLNYYKIALSECQAIMARPDQHTLNASFQAVFKNAMDAHTIEPNGEVLFEVGMTGGQGTNDSKLGYYDGVKVDASVTGNAAIGVLPTYFYLFDSTDKRRDVTCGPYEVNSNLTTLTGHPITTIAEAKFRRDWLSSPTELTSTGQYYGVDWPIIRFSDVLLMFAEADNEINQGPSAADITALQQVQTRGHGGNASLIPPTPTDYSDFFNAIVKERSLEFGGEGVRKFDLIRWNLLGTRLADAKTNLTNLAARNGTFVGNYAFDTVNFANLPDSEFFNTTGSTITNEVQWGISFYVPRTVSSISGFSKVAWVTSKVAGVLSSSGSSNGFAFDFKANHSELLPIPQAAIDADYNLIQDYGY